MAYRREVSTSSLLRECEHLSITDQGEGCDAYCLREMVAICYRIGMSKQIAVRLPDELVEFVDSAVASGDARSRASVVTRALERERRRAVAERDAEILAGTGPDPELVGLALYAAGVPSTRA